MIRIPDKNFPLILIIVLSFLLNIIGLYPNTYFSQHEPGLIAPADQIIKNFILEGNIDPNVEPAPFKYASTLFYFQSILRGSSLLFIHQTYNLTGFTFGFDDTHFKNILFSDFVINNGPFLFGNALLWISRLQGVLSGTGTVLLTYLITQRVFKGKLNTSKIRSLSLLAALALSGMPLFVRNSHYATADIPQVFFFALSFLISLKILDKPNFKTYAFAGFLVGFSVSLKYFPLALIPFLIIHLLAAKKKITSRPFLFSIFSIFLGYLAGMPYLFVHFDKIAGFIPYALSWYGPDQLTEERPLFSRFLPSYFHFFHFKFLISDGLLLIPFIASIAGIVIGSRKYPYQTFLLLIIPGINGIFITFYVKQIYEQLTLPMLPFIAIFISLAIYQLLELAGRLRRKGIRSIASVLILLLVFLPSFLNSAQASVDCGKEITDFQTRLWLAKNIKPDSIVAYHPGTRHPSVDMVWVESTVKGDFSLAELQDQKAQYLILIDGYYRTAFEWTDDLLLPTRHIVDNQYPLLAVQEIRREAKLIKEIKKHTMCTGNKMEIYELPQPLKPSVNLIKSFSFNSEEDTNKFSLLNAGEEIEINTNDKTEYIYKKGAFNNIRSDYIFYYSAPYLSEFIPAEGEKKYTAKLNYKSEIEDKAVKRDGYLRIDFYDESNKSIKTSLSPKGTVTDDSRQLTVTASAPANTSFLRIGFQSLVLSDNGKFLLERLSLFEN